MQADNTSKSEETTIAPSGETSGDKDRSVGWSNLQIETTRENEIYNVHYGFAQAIDMKKKITIDTRSSALVMCDQSYCDKIDKSDKVIDIETNGGVMQSGPKCEVDKLGESWSNKNH